MRFRPCIDLHNGVVKQIVGGTLRDDTQTLTTNFVADRPPSYYADLYRRDNLTGGHIIRLGPGNDAAAREALAAWPDGMQIGGGITDQNAASWLDCGATHVIVTSFVFRDGQIDWDALKRLVAVVGKKHLVLDLSCRSRDSRYFVVTDRWQKFTDVVVSAETLETLGQYCDEFLIHAADVEGKCSGIEEGLVRQLGKISPVPTTYAGGVRDFADLRLIERLADGRVDVTVGSALDIFGGRTLSYGDLIACHSGGSFSF